MREEEATDGRGAAGVKERTASSVLSTDLARGCRVGACSGSKRGRALAAVVLRVKWGGGSSVKEKGDGRVGS